ncbi:MAG: hypothetical protein DHS20C12_24320 [Pseudohongiella sp.]|nr:MAG: hypothetical protein DHS20C12_24320 [Pseudohongiella sp.]
MKTLIKEKFESYPDEIQSSLLRVRELVFDVAKEDGLGPVEESLKWGELSYRATGGSAVRLGWRDKSPDNLYVFFHCQTSLIETFKELYGDLFKYEGSRAIALDLSRPLAIQELKHCIALAMQYHKLKHLPLLGA